MSNSEDLLDADELFHLAIKASDVADHEKAIRFLKLSNQKDPQAKTAYLLAAEHAEIGMFDRAIEEMAHSVELDPTLWTAHFQLGLLHFTQGRAPEAAAAWSNLDVLGEDDALFQFKSGFVLLSEDNLIQAKDCIEKGIELNIQNPALNGDMKRVLADITKALNPENEVDSALEQSNAATVEAAKKEPEEVKTEGKDGKHLFLSLYGKDDDKGH
ncbi:MAG: hypothetical protein JKY54_12955 [Flavobacteriales bacterium]|nr:hypothetical protein [Flavobacteriales bacterium]